ncbi:MAG: TIGR04282 family arsenosugar biosynthesis glycosyltransferase [Rhodobacteraceae bacterium]|nr:TIGR04282 family arsenosugar biosynthesis glycosyltransferase [Paracoccaceae bacterium]
MAASSGVILAVKPTLIIMVKQPSPGRVKTRLARDIGHIAAAAWYRRQCRALIRRLSRDPRWQVVLAVSPDHQGMVSRVWPAALPRMAQGPGDIGARMARLLAAAPRPALLIGSDIPGITQAHIARAIRALGGHDMVFGPAEDGGFWLAGLNRGCRPPRFDCIRWSGPHALADTLAGLGDRRIALTETLRDVDCAADLP